MNEGQTESQKVTVNYSYADAQKVIKEFLNDINESISTLKYGYDYDTKELYLTYDMLRYEILTDDNIRILYEKNLTDLVVNKLNVFKSLLDDLMSQLRVTKGKYYEADNNARISENNIASIKKEMREDEVVFRAILSTLLAATVVFQPYLLKNPKADSKEEEKVYPAYEYTIDANGNTSSDEVERTYKYQYGRSPIVIEKYSKVNKKGYRVKTTYLPEDGLIKYGDDQELANLGDDKLEEIAKEVIEFDENGNIPREEYTNVIRYNYDDIKHANSLNIGEILLLLLEVAILIIHCGLLFYLLDQDSIFEGLSELYGPIIWLTKYKLILTKERIRLKAAGRQGIKLEKTINTLCNRVDKLIVEFTNQIANQELLKEKQKFKQARQLEEKEEQLKKEQAEKQKQKIDKISSIITELSTELSTINNYDEKELEGLYHKIQISEESLFEKVGDHLRIKSVFIPFLRFFNLSLIDFDDVDIRYIDFTGTNASVNLRKVYKMDASFCKFDDQNIHDWSDYNGVNLSGATLDEDIYTMVSLDKAIIDKDTTFRPESNKQEL